MPDSDRTLSVELARAYCRWAACALGATTLLVHLSQIAGLSLAACARLAAGAILGVTAAEIWRLRRWLSRDLKTCDWPVVAILAGTAAASVLLSLLSHLPDADDYYYLGNAVYAREHPAAAMSFQIHFLYPGLGEPLFESLLINTSQAYEYTAAIVAYCAHINLLTVYYGLFVANNAALLVAAMYYLLTRFRELDTMAAAAGTLVALAGLTLLAVTHRSPGSFAFTRIFQGKAVLLTVWTPLFAAVSMDYFRAATSRGAWASGILLFAIAVSGLGLSSTALVFLPALALVLFLAALAARWVRLASYGRVAGYFASLSYLGLGIIYSYRQAVGNLGIDSVANRGWPTTFWGHLAFWVDPQRPATLLVLIAASAAAVMLLRGPERRFLFAWFAAAMVLFLNPATAPFLIRHVTGPNIYWRMFYLYPVAPAIGVCAAKLLIRSRTSMAAGWRIGLWPAAVLVLLGAHFVPGMPSAFRAPHERFVWPPVYKLPTDAGSCARELISLVPPGPMLAPDEISGAVPLFSSGYPQCRVRDAVLLWLGAERGRMREARQRIAASDFAGNGHPDLKPDFVAFVGSRRAASDLRSIVLSADALNRPGISDFILAAGFDQRRPLRQGNGRYWVCWSANATPSAKPDNEYAPSF